MARLPDQPPDDLDLAEDRAFQEKWWTAERVAWGVFLLIVASALIGLTGAGGWLANATASGEGGSVEYPRQTRWQADDTVLVRLAASPAASRTVTLSSAFTSLFQLIDIEPQPARATATPDGEQLEFFVAPGEPASIALQVRSQRPGLVSYFTSIDSERLDATTFILP
jgi:hypothetical protein